MIWFIRILFLLAFALYWGGLTFYTGVDVRISHDVLNYVMDGGLITQRVTAVLQLLGLGTPRPLHITDCGLASATGKVEAAIG